MCWFTAKCRGNLMVWVTVFQAERCSRARYLWDFRYLCVKFNFKFTIVRWRTTSWGHLYISACVLSSQLVLVSMGTIAKTYALQWDVYRVNDMDGVLHCVGQLIHNKRASIISIFYKHPVFMERLPFQNKYYKRDFHAEATSAAELH